MKPAGIKAIYAGLLVAACLPHLVTADTETSTDLLKLDSSIDAARSALQKAQQSQQTMAQKLQSVATRIDRIGKKLHHIARDQKHQQRRLHEHQQQRQTLQQEYQRNTKLLQKQIRAAYFSGKQEFIKLLFNQDNPATLGRALTYYDYYHRARLERMQQITGKISKIAHLEHQIEQDQQQLQGLARAYQAEHLTLKTNQQEQSQLLGKINKEIQSRDQELVKLLDQKKHLENVLSILQNETLDLQLDRENGKPFAYYKGSLEWPAQGKMLKRYGSARIGGLKWQGVVIGATEGQEVHAVGAGRIAFTDWLPGYGMVIIVDHGQDYLSLYGYNQALLRNKGDWVDKGETIAVIGNSGGLGKPGLYFEIRHRTKALNPARWLRQYGPERRQAQNQ